MEAHSLSTCDQCGKTFQRKAHLLRHQQQHSGDRPYTCKFCTKTFKRSDVLRDHFSRCDRRGNSAIPSSLERGRKRHACDECSRLKVKCDSNVPCKKCKEFGRACVKRRPTTASSPGTATTTSSTSTSSTTTNSDICSLDRNSIRFLLNFAGEADFMREFPKDSTASSPNSLVEKPDPNALHNGMGYMFGPDGQFRVPPSHSGHIKMPMESSLDIFLSNLDLGTFECQTNNFQTIPENTTQPGHSPISLDRVVLEQISLEIRARLESTAVTMSLPNPPSKEILEAIQVINARHMATWIRLYFRHFHKHGPVLHEATFNPATAALPLVLAMMSIGAMYSIGGVDAESVRLLLDTIETCIFSFPALDDEYDLPGRQFSKLEEDSSLELQRYRLDELQSAYLMIVLQYWSGNLIARKRVRQQRFSRVAAIIHQLDMRAILHPQDFVINDRHSFQSWILREAHIRTISMALLMDNVFGIFNNVPPRINWAELDLPFPSDDRHFKVASYDEMTETHLYPDRKMKIEEAFLILFLPSEASKEKIKVLRDGCLTALDMQLLIHFLYSHLWTHTFGNPLISLPTTNMYALLVPFKTALWSWKAIWNEIKSSSPQDEWEKLGFQRSAQSYCDTVGALMNVLERTGGRVEGIKGDCEKGDHLRTLLSL